MTIIHLVRHGQASFGKEDYDNLSEIGLKQAFLLGQHFKALNLNFDKIFVGTLKRQIQTYKQIIKSYDTSIEHESSDLLNEYDVKSVLMGFVNGRSLTKDELQDKKTHFNLLRNAVTAWSENKVFHGVNETWKEFDERAQKFLNIINKNKSKSILVVSSGGTISMILKQILSLPSSQFVNFHFQIFNSSYSQIKINEFGMSLSLFNSIAHLDHRKDSNLITYV
jgi:broad specificity phosphatase PhoE